MKTKLKKILKSWLVFSIIVGFFIYLKGIPQEKIIYFIAGIYVLIATVILLGWDKYITYGDEGYTRENPIDNQYYEDVDDMP